MKQEEYLVKIDLVPLNLDNMRRQNQLKLYNFGFQIPDNKLLVNRSLGQILLFNGLPLNCCYICVREIKQLNQLIASQVVNIDSKSRSKCKFVACTS